MGQTSGCACRAEDESYCIDPGWAKGNGAMPLPHVVLNRVKKVRAFVEEVPVEEVPAKQRGIVDEGTLRHPPVNLAPPCLRGLIAKRTGGMQRLEEAGLSSVFREAAAKNRRAIAISSITDPDDDSRAAFKEKVQEVMYPPGGEKEEAALLSWLQDGLGIGWACKKGFKGMPNQDSYSVLAVEDSFILLGVYDGHGPRGHDISQLAKEILVRSFLAHPKRQADAELAFHECFLKCQEEISRARPELKAEVSGTTCTMAYVDLAQSRFTVAHVADSRAVLGWRHRPDAGLAGCREALFEVDELTLDHKPNLEQERARIEGANPPGRVVFDGIVNYRVCTQHSMYPGLNMSRALGDLEGHREAGITATPDTRTVDLKPLLCGSDTDVMLLLCSDGVWEFVQSTQALPVAATSMGRGPLAVANRLALEGWDRWITESGGTGTDDITAVCVRLEVALASVKP